MEIPRRLCHGLCDGHVTRAESAHRTTDLVLFLCPKLKKENKSCQSRTIGISFSLLFPSTNPHPSHPPWRRVLIPCPSMIFTRRKTKRSTSRVSVMWYFAGPGPSLLTFRVPHFRSQGAVRSETRGGLGYICGHRWSTGGS